MTAYESEEFLETAKEAGVGSYLIKPPDPASIHRAVEMAVARNNDLMELQRVNRELREALAHIKTLEGILPICASCKKIRDKADKWHPLETYISQHTDARFSHGCCPECMKRLYPEFAS